jgi:hypothetical protein
VSHRWGESNAKTRGLCYTSDRDDEMVWPRLLYDDAV